MNQHDPKHTKKISNKALLLVLLTALTDSTLSAVEPVKMVTDKSDPIFQDIMKITKNPTLHYYKKSDLLNGFYEAFFDKGHSYYVNIENEIAVFEIFDLKKDQYFVSTDRKQWSEAAVLKDVLALDGKKMSKNAIKIAGDKKFQDFDILFYGAIASEPTNLATTYLLDNGYEFNYHFMPSQFNTWQYLYATAVASLPTADERRALLRQITRGDIEAYKTKATDNGRMIVAQMELVQRAIDLRDEGRIYLLRDGKIVGYIDPNEINNFERKSPSFREGM